MEGSARLQPNPKIPLAEPESYENDNCGPNPDRPGLVAIGTVIEPVPVTGLAANFSPMPRMAPPPLGRVRFGTTDGSDCDRGEAAPGDGVSFADGAAGLELKAGLSVRGICASLREVGARATS